MCVLKKSLSLALTICLLLVVVGATAGCGGADKIAERTFQIDSASLPAVARLLFQA